MPSSTLTADGIAVYLGDFQTVFPAQGLDLLDSDGKPCRFVQGMELDDTAEPPRNLRQDALADHGPAGRLSFFKKPLCQFCWRGGFSPVLPKPFPGFPTGKAKAAGPGGEVSVGGEDKYAPAEIQFPFPGIVRPVGGAAALIQDGHENL